MATINSREIVDQIIAHSGHFIDDDRVVKIVQYENNFNGNLVYGLIYEGEDLDRYCVSQFIHNPVVLWEV